LLKIRTPKATIAAISSSGHFERMAPAVLAAEVVARGADVGFALVRRSILN